MGAVGAMAPTNFPKDTFGTHEISNSMYIGTSYLIDCQPGQQSRDYTVPIHTQVTLVCYNSSPYSPLMTAMNLRNT